MKTNAQKIKSVSAAALGFIIITAIFFWSSMGSPLEFFQVLLKGAFADGYAISETLVKATPVLWCALAVAVPAKLGLVSIGAEGQMYAGSLVGAGYALFAPHQPAWILLPMMALLAAAGGGAWGALAGVLKARFSINETVISMLLNFVAVDLVDYLIHGPWMAADSGNWPQTASFPEAAILPAINHNYRTHVGLLVAIPVAVMIGIIFKRTRWGLEIQLLHSNPRIAPQAGLNYSRYIIGLMAVGGMLAGLGGIGEASAIQNRLESHFLPSYGLSGYLVAWLAGHDFFWIIPLSIGMGAILTSADTLQLFAKLPASSALILQGILFSCCVGFMARGREAS